MHCCFFQAPHCCNMRSSLKMGDVKLVDSMMLDGLIDAFHGYHMGITGKSIKSYFLPCWYITDFLQSV